MAMFGRFTEKAQQALVYGQQEAAALNHNYVGTCLLYTSRCV